jgi:hypothetical protein
MHISKAGLGRLQAFPLLFQAGWGTPQLARAIIRRRGATGQWPDFISSSTDCRIPQGAMREAR